MNAPAQDCLLSVTGLAKRFVLHMQGGLAIPVFDGAGLSVAAGERVNLARAFALGYPVLLLDEPTASLDAENSRVVVELIEEARARGAAVVGIFHDPALREAVATQSVDVASLGRAA